MLTTVAQGATAAVPDTVVAAHGVQVTLLILPLHVPCAGVPGVPTTLGLGQLHTPAPEVAQVATEVNTDVDVEDAQYATQALSVPSVIRGCSKSCGVM